MFGFKLILMMWSLVVIVQDTAAYGSLQPPPYPPPMYVNVSILYKCPTIMLTIDIRKYLYNVSNIKMHSMRYS